MSILIVCDHPERHMVKGCPSCRARLEKIIETYRERDRAER